MITIPQKYNLPEIVSLLLVDVITTTAIMQRKEWAFIMPKEWASRAPWQVSRYQLHYLAFVDKFVVSVSNDFLGAIFIIIILYN